MALRRLSSTQNGYAFKFVAPSLRGAEHRSIAWAAVRRCGLALRWVGPDLQNDLALAWAAVTRQR
jgi:hypothetical protein